MRSCLHRRSGKIATGVAALWFVAIFAPGISRAAEPSLETIAREAILVDATTGAVLLERNADAPTPPASMIKMMTAYMVFERLKKGNLSLDDVFAVSDNAWRKGGAKSGGSTMFLNPGERVPLEALLRGIVVQSGNDASIVVAEGLAGSEDKFAAEMNVRARALGLGNTAIRNSTGLPDLEQMTTVRDLAILARRTIEDFPEYYHYYAERNFAHGGIRQGNRNPLLYKDLGVDGLKTGHTEASGYGLAISAKRGERRLILVLNGVPTINGRAREAERLIDWGFREFQNYALFKAGDRASEAEVWLGMAPRVSLRVENDLIVTLPRASRRDMKVVVRYDGPIAAPIAAGSPIAKLVVTAPKIERLEVPLVAAESVDRLGLFGRLSAAFKSIFWGVAG